MERLNHTLDRHKDKFGTLPVILGMFWNDPDQLIKNIEKAIKDNKPYNENDLLPKGVKVSEVLF